MPTEVETIIALYQRRVSLNPCIILAFFRVLFLTNELLNLLFNEVSQHDGIKVPDCPEEHN